MSPAGRWQLAGVALALTTGACAVAAPREPVQRALVRDLTRIVDSREQVTWAVDELDVEAVLPDALASACAVPATDRDAVVDWLDERVVAEGGPVEEAWERAGRDLDAVEDLLFWTRVQKVARATKKWADEGKCPFWIEADPGFIGNQGLGHKFIFATEYGSRFYMQSENGEPGFGGGGAARILGGYGVTDAFSLLLGLEFGGAGRFTDIEIGRRADVPAIVVVGAAPILSRFHRLSTHFDLGIAPVAYVNQLRGDVQWGGRTEIGIGTSYLRLRGVLPSLSFSIGYDYLPGTHGLPTVHQVSAGVRAGAALAW